MTRPARALASLLALVFAALPSTLSAQRDQLRFEHLSVEDGLSQNRVYAILQDRLGFMWFGTQQGLNKFDGLRLTTYAHKPGDPHSLSDSYVYSMVETKDGSLWIGTYGGGLNRFDRDTGTFTRFQNEPADPKSLSHNRIPALLEDVQGTLWIGTYGGGLNRFDGKTGTFERFQRDKAQKDSLPDDKVNALFQARDGRLLVGTNGGGVAMLNPGERGFAVLSQANSGLSDDHVFSLLEDRSGTLWVGTSAGGLNCYDPVRKRFTAYRHDPKDPESLADDWVKALLEDSEGALWVATSGGLSRLDPTTGRFRNFHNDPVDSSSLAESSQLSLFEDRGGVLWFGTYGGGVDRVSLLRKRFVNYRSRPGHEGLADRVVRSLTEDRDGQIWIGTQNGGLNSFNPETEEFRTYQQTGKAATRRTDNQIHAVFEDSRRRLWAGTFTAGLCLVDRRTGLFDCMRSEPATPGTLSHNSVRAIVEDSKGLLWVATFGGGLNRVDPEARTATVFRAGTPSGLTDDYIHSMVKEDGRDVLWIVTRDGGVLSLDIPSLTFHAYVHDPARPDSLNSPRASVVFLDRERRVYIGTFGDGLNRLDPLTGRAEHFFDARPGARNDILAILEDDRGRLWMSTNHGLVRFDPKDSSFRGYDARDGLEANEFNLGAAVKGRDGRLYFGGARGFTAFTPDEIRDNPTMPPVRITGFKKFNRDVALGKDISSLPLLTFDHKDDVITFEFAALDFTAPTKNRLAYQLQGFDPAFTEVPGMRSATYTNLPAGGYVFRVKGSNADGVWNETGASLSIFIRPPPYRTWWFVLSSGLALLGAAFWAIHVWVRVQRSRERRLLRLVEERTDSLLLEKQKAEEAYQAKSRFLANMSHELRTPLNAILGFVQLMGRKGDRDPEDKEHLSIIMRSGEHLLGLINEVLSIAKIESGQVTLNEEPFDPHALIQGVADMFHVEARSSGLKFDVVVSPGVPPHVRGDEGRLREVLINLLSNAFKFTDQGSVTLSMSWSDGRGRFAVADTGAGISAHEMEALFQPFSQTETGQKASEGTGLGLVISRNFVRLMGGDIQVDSRPGKGSTFRFEVALPAAEAFAKKPSERRVLGLAPGQPCRRVLVVDDKWENRTLLTRILTSVGFEVREAVNGAEAVDLFSSWRPDMIWMDMRMPVVNGYAATEEIRRLENGDLRVPIVALTATVFESDRDAIQKAGCDDFVAKPFREDVIYKKMAEHLRVEFRYDEDSKERSERSLAASGVALTAYSTRASGVFQRVTLDRPPKKAMDPEVRLAALSTALAARLREAVEGGEREVSYGVAEEIRRVDDELAEHLRRMIKAYEFDEILALLDKAGEASQSLSGPRPGAPS